MHQNTTLYNIQKNWKYGGVSFECVFGFRAFLKAISGQFEVNPAVSNARWQVGAGWPGWLVTPCVSWWEEVTAHQAVVQCIGAGLLPLQRHSDHTCSIKQETSGDTAPINGHNTEEATDLNTDSFNTATMVWNKAPKYTKYRPKIGLSCVIVERHKVQNGSMCQIANRKSIKCKQAPYWCANEMFI